MTTLPCQINVGGNSEENWSENWGKVQFLFAFRSELKRTFSLLKSNNARWAKMQCSSKYFFQRSSPSCPFGSERIWGVSCQHKRYSPEFHIYLGGCCTWRTLDKFLDSSLPTWHSQASSSKTAGHWTLCRELHPKSYFLRILQRMIVSPISTRHSCNRESFYLLILAMLRRVTWGCPLG